MKWASVWDRPAGGLRVMPVRDLLDRNLKAYTSGSDTSLSPLAVAETMVEAMAINRELKRMRATVMKQTTLGAAGPALENSHKH